MKYYQYHVERKINYRDLLFILDNLRVGTLVTMPGAKDNGQIYLKFVCLGCCEGDVMHAKFTNDDRRTFIKLAKQHFLSSLEISYTSSLKHIDP
jgi:hypothetical protein